MSKLFTVSPSPHIHSGNSIERLMYDVLLALVPAFLERYGFSDWVRCMLLSYLYLAVCCSSILSKSIC